MEKDKSINWFLKRIELYIASELDFECLYYLASKMQVVMNT